MVERRPEKPCVPSSILGLGTFLLSLAGIILLLRHYGANLPLGSDEAALTIEIFRRSFLSILVSHSYNPNLPTASVGFLILVKAAADLLGRHEGILRLWPMIFASLSVVLLPVLVEKFAGARAKLPALALFVFCGPATRRPRTWVILSDLGGGTRQAVLDYFEKRGKKVLEFNSTNSSIFLYNLG